MNTLDLARMQFGVTTLFHFIFVPMSIGLALFVAICQTRWHRSGNEVYLRMMITGTVSCQLIKPLKTKWLETFSEQARPSGSSRALRGFFITTRMVYPLQVIRELL